MSDLCYCQYAFAQPECRVQEIGPGVDPHFNVELIREGPIAAVTSRVGLDQFGGANLNLPLQFFFGLFESAPGQAFGGHIPEDQYCADDPAIIVADRRTTVPDGITVSVFGDQHGVIRQADDSPFLQDFADRILDFALIPFVDDVEHLFQRSLDGVAQAPTGQLFRHRIHARDPTLRVHRDDRITDAVQGDRQVFDRLAVFGDLDL